MCCNNKKIVMDSSSSALPSTDKDDVLLPPSLEHARINTLPQTAYYIPNFITEQEEQNILDKLPSLPGFKTQSYPVCSRCHPRTPQQRTYSKEVLTRSRIMSSSMSIHLVLDGAAYWPVVATVSLGASLCLNLHRSKEDGALDPEPAWRILQEPRSLLVTTDELYTEYLHGIADIEEDADLSAETVANWDLLRSPGVYANGRNIRQTRTSLTYRDVLQVSKVANKLGIFLKR
ncbi:tRNA pseudouridine synthase 1 [Fusarium oxysporum f. sp. albedinis]|nr:tRNA pseudouridine synthase 1 [Fusarium oxysporum f. sp. albedinis]